MSDGHAAKLAILAIVVISVIPVTLAGYALESNVHRTTLRQRLCPEGYTPTVYQSSGYGGSGTLQIRCSRGETVSSTGRRFHTHYNKEAKFQKFDRLNPARGEKIYG